MFFFWRVKLKRKINLIKEQKKRKEMRIKLEKIIHHELGMKDKIENIKTFTKGPKRKNRNQKRDQIGKTYT